MVLNSNVTEEDAHLSVGAALSFFISAFISRSIKASKTRRMTVRFAKKR